ncbi:MAG: HD domain-containing protein [Pseudomonadota bacterium]
MIVEFAIVFTILGYIAYVVLNTTRRGATRKKKNALANLEKLYQLHHNQTAREDTATHQQEAPQQPDVKTVSEQSPQAWRPQILSFYDEYILPYINVLDHNSFLSPVERLLTILDQHGDCPSVVHSQSDQEYQGFSKTRNIYNALARITLLEHSLNVTRELIETVKKQAKDYDVSIGKWLIIGLSHDIGKIPSFRTGPYATGDHPIISCSHLETLLPKDLPARREIITAVRDHHFSEAEAPATRLLRQADRAARNIETQSVSQTAHVALQASHAKDDRTQPEKSDRKKEGRPETVDLSWLDKEKLLSMIEKQINIIHNNQFRAFSLRNGLVYVWLATITSIVQELASQSNHTNVLTEHARDIEFSVRQMLDKFIPDFIGKGYPGARFRLLDKDGRVLGVGLYMPIKVEAFTVNISDLETRKTGKLLKIQKVEPLVGKQSTTRS